MNFDNHLDDRYVPVAGTTADEEMDWGMTPPAPAMTAVDILALPEITVHQKEKADIIIQHLLTKGVASLSGKGGVGKTFTTGYIIEQLEKVGCYASIVATTNKAASILEKEIKREVKTAHSFLKFKEHQGEFTSTEDTKYVKADFIVLDELSLLDKHILNTLYKMFKEQGTKLLFVGDKTQLIFNKDVTAKIDTIPTEYLLVNMRADADSQIAKFCSDQSDAIREGKGLINIYDYQGADLVIHHDQHEFYSAFDVLPFQDDKVVISFRNKTTLRHDEILQGRSKGTMFMSGDTIRSRDTMKLTASAAEALGRNAGDIIIRTSEIFKIINVEYDEQNMWYRVQHEEKGFVFYIPEFPDRYDRDVKRMLQLCKSGERAWRDYYSLKEAFCRVFHNQFITCHSAQGSSFETVFVDYRDMKCTRTEDDLARLIYTGISRARTMVHVLV